MEIRNTCSLNTTDDELQEDEQHHEECSCLVLTQIFYGSNKRCQTLVRLYHECFKAAFKVKWCNFLNWLLVLFWRCWVILSTLLTMTHHKPRYITTNSRPWNVVIEVFGQKYVDIWRPSADEERSCESLVEIGLNVNLNKNVAAARYYYYLIISAFVSVKNSGFFYEWQKNMYFDVQLHYDTVISTQNYSNITVMYCVFLHQPH